MNATQVADVLTSMSGQPLPFDDICAQVRAAGSDWSPAQVRLLLSHLGGLRHDVTADTYAVAVLDEEAALAAAVIEAVQSFQGKPVPAAQVRDRLPNHFITTNEQVLALARAHASLEVFGPGLLKLSGS